MSSASQTTKIPYILSSEPLRITPLGAGNEVGRSCIILNYKGKTIMLDCGIHPAYNGLGALPFFDEIDPASVDIVLITHFHLDHAASLPYFTEKTTFKGRIYMTHPTKAIYKWLLSDYVRVSNVSGTDDLLFTEQDLLRSYDKIIPIDFHQQIEVDGVKFTAYNAGHVLGAAMFLIEIAGVRIFYTGDYSREEDRHLMIAERPPTDHPVDVMICEATFGVQSHLPRPERESRFTSLIHEIVGRGGRCLLPVFALGRAQELLLVLDEYWENHPELQHIPIYFASSLAKRCMTIYQTYINMMNDKIKKQFATSNPFILRHVTTLKSIEQFDDVGPCVMMASPGMLQNGLSRELLELWCPNKKNGVIIAGYSVEGTLAKQIMSEPAEITAMSGAKIPLRMTVESISFAAHVDFPQNSQFIDEINPSNLIFVHGEQNEMSRLRNALQHKYDQRLHRTTSAASSASFSGLSTLPDNLNTNSSSMLKMFCPRNCETIQLEFCGEKFARVIGNAATSISLSHLNRASNDGINGTFPTGAHNNKCDSAHDRMVVSGVLVGKDFEYEIVDACELQEFTNLSMTVLKQRLHFTCSASFSLLEFYICQLFGKSQVKRVSPSALIVMAIVKVEDSGNGRDFLMEWEGNAINDMIADSIAAIAAHAETSRSSVKLTKSSHSHSHLHSKHQTSSDVDITINDNNAHTHSVDEGVILSYLGEHFEDVAVDEDAGKFIVSFDEGKMTAIIDIETMEVECESKERKKLIEQKLYKVLDIFQIL